jgi:DNA-binding transcriptional regulator LsrR (DeoR family)
MPRPHRDLDRILHIARLHYEDRLTQGEIAAQLSLSVATVSRHLRQAKVLGLIEIRVASSAYRDFAVEADLVRRLGLVSACVVRSAGSAAATERVLAAAAARKLDELVSPHTVIGVSNGRTLAAVVSEVRRARSPDVDVVTLIGGIGRAESASQTGEICRTLAERLGGRAWILPVPAVVESPAVAAALREAGAAAEVFALVGRVSVAAFGIGAMVPGSSTFQHGLFGDRHLAAMAERGAVGSICARFYDGDGAMLRSAMDACTLSVDLERLAAVPARLGVAFGADKVDAIDAAVRGRLVSHLATDGETAAALLARAGERPDDGG